MFEQSYIISELKITNTRPYFVYVHSLQVKDGGVLTNFYSEDMSKWHI